MTSNLPFNEWTEIFGSERLTGALLDRLTHHVHILELNGDSYRLAHSKHARKRRCRPGVLTPPPATPLAVQPGLHCVRARPGGVPRLRFSPPAQPSSNTPPGGRMV